METIEYQVTDLLEARKWFDTLLYGKPRNERCDPPTDSVIYNNIPNQERITLILKLVTISTEVDTSDTETYYWIISNEAHNALKDNRNTKIYKKLRPIPYTECSIGIIGTLYISGDDKKNNDIEEEPIIRPRKRVGVIVNPNLGIIEQSCE